MFMVGISSGPSGTKIVTVDYGVPSLICVASLSRNYSVFLLRVSVEIVSWEPATRSAKSEIAAENLVFKVSMD